MLELLEGHFIGLKGNSLALWMINNNGYEMKSIDKLHNTFPAGQSYDKWHKLNVEYDVTKGFGLFFSWECVVYRKACGHVCISMSKQCKSTIQPLPGAPGNPRSVISLVTTDQTLNFCQSHFVTN